MKRRSIASISIFLLALFGLLISQFYKLQVIQHPKWLRKAQIQHEALITEPAKRGTFWSNTEIASHHTEPPQPLALDVPKFHLHADPAVIPSPLKGEIAEKLMTLCQIDSSADLAKKGRNRKLKMWLSRKEQEEILNWWLPYAKSHKIPRNALFFVADYKRSYPFNTLAGQLLHTIRDLKDEQTSGGIPTGGLEAYFNEQLQGKPGTRWLLRSPRRPLAVGGVIEKACDGFDIQLTINHVLQAIAEEEIKKSVVSAEAKGGWALMLHPYTGEILAFAQYPPFAPERYQEYFNDPEKIPDTLVRGASYAFEPGSTIKPLTLALALKANEELKEKGEKLLFAPHEKIPCSDGHFPGRSKPILDTHVHRYLNMELALQKSSNIYVGKLANQMCDRLGNSWYRSSLQEIFGFGDKTNIELPGETRGFLPTPLASYKNGALQWAKSTPPSLAMGYNLLVSSLQTARAFAVIANGGWLTDLTLVKRINGVEVSRKAPRKVLSKEICDQVVRAMKFSTKPGGTAWRGDIMGYTQAGKTGTSEKIVSKGYSKSLHFTNFAGFAPATKPEFVLFVAIDEPRPYALPAIGSNHFGGRWATRTFREIAKRSLIYLGVPPDDPHGYPKGDPRFDPEKADWAKEVTALKQLYEEWNEPS